MLVFATSTEGGVGDGTRTAPDVLTMRAVADSGVEAHVVVAVALTAVPGSGRADRHFWNRVSVW